MRRASTIRLVLPAYNYRAIYRGLLTVRDNTILIRRVDTITVDPHLPINPVGLSAVMLELDAIRRLMSTINHSNNEYPIVFVFNSIYGQSSPTSSTSIAYLGGAAVLDSTYDQNIRYLVGYSRAGVYKNNGWDGLTTCTRGGGRGQFTCKLYLTLIIDPEVLRGLRRGRVSIEIHIDDETLSSNDVTLYEAEYRSVNIYERTFIELEEPRGLYSHQCIRSMVSDRAEVSLCPADAEVIHLGAQLVMKGNVYDIARDKRRYMYFVMPTVISYSARLPRDPMRDTALPKDYIFNTALLRLSIRNFNWDNALELIDWLWNRHRDSILKLFLNMNVMRSLWRIFRGRVGNTRPPFIEYTVTTQLYDRYLVNYSLNLRRFTELYYRISRNHASIADLVREIFNLHNINLEISTEEEQMVRRVLAIYALMYGLHGISHLLMKALSALTGLDSYGELISITIDANGLSEDVRNVLSDHLFSTNRRRVYHENVFHVSLGSQFQLDVEIFSKRGYSFHHVRELLSDSTASLNINSLINAMSRLLLIDGDDRCSFNWSMERRHLEFGRVRFLQGELSDADNVLSDWLRGHYRPTRSLFRVLFSNELVWHLADVLIGRYSEETRYRRYEFLRRLNRYVQFMWPYHLEQCIDGCYNCVMVSRSIRSSTCDMTPLVQELKTSKWAALYLLRYSGLFNATWLD